MREDWKVVPFGDVCEISGGSQPPKNNFIYEPRDGYIRLVQVRDYRTDKYLTYIPIEKAKKFCTKLDIMIGRYGPPIFGIFSGIEGAYNVALMKAIPNEEKLDKEFLRWFLKTHELVRFIEKTSKRAAGQDGVRKDRLYAYPTPIPPIQEQKQIVAILDQAFTAIDQAKANIEKNIVNAKELFQSKLNAIFSQKGDGWEEKSLGEIGKGQTGTTPPTKDKTNYGDYIPFVKPPHFHQDGRINSKESMLSEKGLEKGRLFPANSILMVCIGATIGKTGFSEIPVSANQQINALTPSMNFIPKLLYFALISPFVQNQVISVGISAQATLPIINKSKWLKLKVNLPLNKTEQSVIVKNLENLKENCFLVESKYRLKLSELDDLKKSILQKAFSGELTQKEVEV